MLRVGLIGVGHLAEHLARGWARAEAEMEVILSPRNLERSRRLAGELGFQIADGNAQVVHDSDVVCLCTRPRDVLGAARTLPWREGQVAVSVASGVPLRHVEMAVSPATPVRALPITAAEIGQGVTCLFPEHETVRRLFSTFGLVRTFGTEPEFDIASVHGVVYSISHALLAVLSSWFRQNGLGLTDSTFLAAASVKAASSMVLANQEGSLDERVAEFAKPETLTELALGYLRREGAFSGLEEALSAVLSRTLEIGSATLGDERASDRTAP